MSLNITFTGNTYDENEAVFTGSEVRYQAYFHHVNSGSSPSSWGSALNTILGQYNFNLADIIGTEGSASAGDVVVIVFWTPNTVDRDDDCNFLAKWSALRVVLGTGPGMVSADLYTNDIQIRPNICPNLSWTLPDHADVYQNVTADNNSSDIHQWDFEGVLISGTVTLWQRNSYYTTLQTINDVNNSDYSWDDGSFDLDLPGTTNANHHWTTKGDYTVQLVIEDDCGCTVTGTKPIRIYWREPDCGIICHQANASNEIETPDEIVSFEFDGMIYDDNVSEIYWKINDTGTYGTTNTTISGATASGVVYHTTGSGTAWCFDSASTGAFTNPGNHLIEAWVTWWDGFDYHTKYCSETFNQLKFSGPVVDFDQDPDKAVVASGVKFVNTSTNTSRVGYGLLGCEEYEWRFDDNGDITYYTDKPYSYELQVVPDTEFCKVRLCADWSDGWETQTTCTEKDVVFKTTITVSGVDCYYGMHVYGTADDGTVGGYHWDIYKYTTYSGTGPPTGTTELIWETPINTDQKYKEICFTQTGWYKIVGWVYPDPLTAGTETSDYEYLEVTEVCPDTGFTTVAVCEPVLESHEVGDITMSSSHLRPRMWATTSGTPCSRTIKTFPFYTQDL